MKTIYILLTRSGTLLSNLVYRLTGARYTHASLAFDEDLSCLYSSTRKNGYTMFPAGPSREYLDRTSRPRPQAPARQPHGQTFVIKVPPLVWLFPRSARGKDGVILSQ